MRSIRNIILSLKKYGFLIKQLVSRDFKVKYKRSVLGVAWSLLYPVLMMSVMAIIFSNVFKFSVPGVNYLVYLLTGLTYFNYFSEASNLSMSSIIANFGLINKVYIPKYIFPLTKCLFMFTVGMGFVLAAVAVFLRDMLYIYGIVISLWTYLTPIMYDISMLQNRFFETVLKLNPLYQYINFARTIILYKHCPTAGQFIACFVSAALVLLLRTVVFKKTQAKFVYYT